MGDINPGIIVQLSELKETSAYYKERQTLRITGSLETYTAETGTATITEGGAGLTVNVQDLQNVSFQTGCLYQFIGELMHDPTLPSTNKLIMKARVARNVDGLDFNLYDKALHIRRQFEQKYLQVIHDFSKDDWTLRCERIAAQLSRLPKDFILWRLLAETGGAPATVYRYRSGGTQLGILAMSEVQS